MPKLQDTPQKVEENEAKRDKLMQECLAKHWISILLWLLTVNINCTLLSSPLFCAPRLPCQQQNSECFQGGTFKRDTEGCRSPDHRHFWTATRGLASGSRVVLRRIHSGIKQLWSFAAASLWFLHFQISFGFFVCLFVFVCN